MGVKTKKVAQKPVAPTLIPTAAYARVSTDKDAMLESLSAQVSYYSNLIQNHPGWSYAGVYPDEAYTGTKDSRPEFQRLLEDCRAGKVKQILVKSISRLARNTVTLLETVRELKALGVDVYFQRENIHTMSADGELMLSIIAAVAQEESRSVSDNCKWRVRNDFAKGIPNGIKVLGYRFDDGNYQIVSEEAAVVKMIFSDYLSGMGRMAIAKKLCDMGAPTRFGGEWSQSTIYSILRNIMYVGDLLLQKTYITDHLTKTQVKNRGELPSYYVQNNHEPIIDRDTFERVQQEIARRKARHCGNNPHIKHTYAFTGMIVCGQCGKHYRRKITAAGTKYEKPVWICETFNQKGKSQCASKQIPEAILEETVADVLGEDWKERGPLKGAVDRIVVYAGNRLEFELNDGEPTDVVWKDHSRKESWDEAARERAREHARKRYNINEE